MSTNRFQHLIAVGRLAAVLAALAAAGPDAAKQRAITSTTAHGVGRRDHQPQRDQVPILQAL